MGARGNDYRRKQLRRRLEHEESNCWLCGFPLQPDAQPFTDLATEIDEEVPASMGGDVYGVRTPCHLVHRKCNIKKGGRIMEQGSLRGWFIAGEKRAEEQAAKPSRRWL